MYGKELVFIHSDACCFGSILSVLSDVAIVVLHADPALDTADFFDFGNHQ